MDNLLPPNATTLERNLADVNARLGDVPTPLRDLMNADTCPAELLPWLAQAMSVDMWPADWSDEQKRATVKTSLPVHRVKGTIGAVRKALASLGIGAQLQEWFNQIPAGAPYTYRLLLDMSQVGVSQAQLQELLRVVAATKNLRSHLDSIRLSVTSRAVVSRAVVASVGHEVTVKFDGKDVFLLMEGALNGMKATEEGVDLLNVHLNKTMPNNYYW